MGFMGGPMGGPMGMNRPPMGPMGGPPMVQQQPVNKPLFPSAIQSGATTVKPPTTYSSNGSSASRPSEERDDKRSLITAISANSRIIHPEEDVSLEELRARMSK